MTPWHELEHAFGTAGDLPELLERLSPDAEDEVWNELWSCVCHQGTVYPASAPVLPHLLSAAARWPATCRAMPLSLAGAIVTPRCVSGEHELKPWWQEVQGLRALALETVTSPGLDPSDFIHLAEAVLALEGDLLWGRCLNRLASGEFEGVCRLCKTDLLLAIGEFGFFAATGDWVGKPAVPREPLWAADAARLQGVGRRLHVWAYAASQPTVANWLLYVFGTGICPRCRGVFDTAGAIAAVEGEAS